MSLPDSLKFKIVSERDVCVVVFSGELTMKSQTTIATLLEEIKNRKCRSYVFKFSEISKIDKSSHRYLISLQNTIRNDLMADVRFCEIHNSFRSQMIDIGIIKAPEYFNSLKEALLSLEKVF
jgi:anti-anti-sigma regulatory factor